jgi:hypothetical protein
VGYIQKRTAVGSRRHVKEKICTQLSTAYLLEANITSLSLKQTGYIIIEVQLSGEMLTVWKP